MGLAFLQAPGVQVEAVGDTWLVFSALSGETHLLNDTSVAILDMLSVQVPVSVETVRAALMVDSGMELDTVNELILGVWDTFLTAGLALQAPTAGIQS